MVLYSTKGKLKLDWILKGGTHTLESNFAIGDFQFIFNCWWNWALELVFFVILTSFPIHCKILGGKNLRSKAFRKKKKIFFFSKWIVPWNTHQGHRAQHVGFGLRGTQQYRRRQWLISSVFSKPNQTKTCTEGDQGLRRDKAAMLYEPAGELLLIKGLMSIPCSLTRTA